MFSLEFLVYVCANVQRLCGELLCGDRIMYVEKLLRLSLCKVSDEHATLTSRLDTTEGNMCKT